MFINISSSNLLRTVLPLKFQKITDRAMATTPHPLTLDAAVKLLTSTMRDPWKANVCSMRMAIAADRIDQALEARDSVSAKTKLARSHPELLRAGIKFLTFKQSPEDFETMINHLIQCRCDSGQTGMRRLHTPNRYRTDGRIFVTRSDVIFDAVATVTNCIILALSELTQHRFHTGNASNNEPRWPQGPEDLLPFGPKDSVAGLEHWVAEQRGYIIFKLAGCLASSHVPFAREVFQSPEFTFSLYWACRHLGAAIKFYHEGDTSPLARKHFFTNPIMAIFQFFDCLSSFDTPEYEMMIIAGRDWIKPILTPLTTILSTLPPEWSKIRMHLKYLSSYVNADLDREPGFAFIKFDRSQLFAEAIEHLNPLEAAFNKMVDVRKRGCWNIQCPSQSEALHSRLCSKCNLIRFCGEKCQKDAWKAASLPHKAVCAKIYSLKEALGSADWSLLWTPDFTYAQFQAMCRTKNVDTEAVKNIAITISVLMISKWVFLEDLKKAEASQKDQLIGAEQEGFARQKSKNIIAGLEDQVTYLIERKVS